MDGVRISINDNIINLEIKIDDNMKEYVDKEIEINHVENINL